jgi:hypothetical protein
VIAIDFSSPAETVLGLAGASSGEADVASPPGGVTEFITEPGERAEMVVHSTGLKIAGGLVALGLLSACANQQAERDQLRTEIDALRQELQQTNELAKSANDAATKAAKQAEASAAAANRAAQDAAAAAEKADRIFQKGLRK